MDSAATIVVAGATGVVGREIVGALEAQGHPSSHLRLAASERSADSEVSYLGETIEVEKLSVELLRGAKLALLALPAPVAKPFAEQAQRLGVWVVDVSPAFRFNPEIPLVLPAVNLKRIQSATAGRIFSCPSPTTSLVLTVLQPLREKLGLSQVFATTLLGTSSSGQRGISELERQSAELLAGQSAEPEAFPHRIGFNLIPQVGPFGEAGWTFEELSLRAEALRIWGADPSSPKISSTAVQAPFFYGCCVSMAVEFKADAKAEQMRQILLETPGIKIIDDPAEKIYPMPMLVTADPTVHVGRIRSAESPRWALMFCAVDNAGRGAALNAVEVGNALLTR